MRLNPWGKPPSSARPSAPCTVSIAADTRDSGSPAAPKNPMQPAFAIAITMSVDAMPFAMAPAMYANRVPWASWNDRSPSHSG